jgi:hypothetical protein
VPKALVYATESTTRKKAAEQLAMYQEAKLRLQTKVPQNKKDLSEISAKFEHALSSNTQQTLLNADEAHLIALCGKCKNLADLLTKKLNEPTIT